MLMRLADAISETPPDQGAQLHRSFWVAWSAIMRVERAGGRWFVEIACGTLIPDSRANVAKLARRGLI
jgi:DNA-binding LytR/AlgR family response regulator